MHSKPYLLNIPLKVSTMFTSDVLAILSRLSLKEAVAQPLLSAFGDGPSVITNSQVEEL